MSSLLLLSLVVSLRASSISYGSIRFQQNENGSMKTDRSLSNGILPTSGIGKKCTSPVDMTKWTIREIMDDNRRYSSNPLQ
jgi:hypothetical protein